MTAPLLQVRDLHRHYRLPREQLLRPAPLVRALQGVDFTLQAGRSLGVVGESGSGKSTLARLVMALEPPTQGQVLLAGRDLHALPAAALRRARADFQMVFQDPFGSLDPRQTVAHIVGEPLAAQGDNTLTQRREKAGAMLDAVGLRSSDLDKYPHEFSGGQRQRIAIARALVTGPKLIVADEPVSALDVSVQAQVLNLMQDLQDQLGVTYLFISHDLAVVDLVCDEVLVLYQGRVVEQGRPQQLFGAAAHPYTRALIDAVPRLRPAPRGAAMPNEAPGKLNDKSVRPEVSKDGVALPWTQRGSRKNHLSASGVTCSGELDGSSNPKAPSLASAWACPYAPRCAFRQDDCLTEPPLLRQLADGHWAACHHPLQPPVAHSVIHPTHPPMPSRLHPPS